mmetsp:Transcript_15534/g.62550  ORF Transcript_15534/g.62550 Transcript_15534/m.62550 type:complete len:402 (-) Transcript_15534:46-1251(-)
MRMRTRRRRRPALSRTPEARPGGQHLAPRNPKKHTGPRRTSVAGALVVVIILIAARRAAGQTVVLDETTDEFHACHDTLPDALRTDHERWYHARRRTAPTLPAELRRAFVRDGFFVRRSLVDRRLVDAALIHVLAALVGDGVDPNTRSSSRRFAPWFCAVQEHDATVAQLLYKSPVFATAEDLVGAANLVAPFGADTHQIVATPPRHAPRHGAAHPTHEARRRRRRRRLLNGGSRRLLNRPQEYRWHVDNFLGVTEKRFPTFTLLVGVALTNQTLQHSGQLVAYPGGHRRVAEYARSVREEEWAVPEFWSADDVARRPSLTESAVINVEPGDVVFLHHKTPHRATTSQNYQPSLRAMVYFRLSHRDHALLERNSTEPGGLFVEFDGISPDLEGASEAMRSR